MVSITDIRQQVVDTYRSIPRQFDDQEGGGFADELGEITDPTQRTSEETESDLRLWSDVVSVMPAGSGYRAALSVSDYLDTEAGRTPPGSSPNADPDSEQTNEPQEGALTFWEKVFRGNTPAEQAGEEADKAQEYLTEQALDSPKITLLLGLLGVGLLLWFIRPFISAANTVS